MTQTKQGAERPRPTGTRREWYGPIGLYAYRGVAIEVYKPVGAHDWHLSIYGGHGDGYATKRAALVDAMRAIDFRLAKES